MRAAHMSGFVLWFTGLSGAGKTTIANNVEPELERRGFVVDHLDGDIVRTHLSKGLGFSKEDRDTNIARIGWVASRLARAGAVVIVSAISPYEEMRRHARSLVEQHAPFVEVFVATPLEECARRDPKGLYAAAFAGEIDEFTGVSAPYEEPLDARAAPGDDRPHAGRVGRDGDRPARGAQPHLRARGVRVVSTSRALPTVTHLDELESEAVHIFREVAAELERPVLLFSGGKDSIVLLRLAEKAFRPGKFPFPIMHVDTGHNFPEAIEYRDRRVAELGERLVIASVQESIDKGRVVEETGPRASRNRLQTTTLLDAIEEHGFDAAIGGARRDEERSRAKERIFSFRDDFGQWNPRVQRPELWNLYNARVRKGEHVRVFPISNWTELDVWQYVAREQLELPPIYFAHEREVFRRDGMLYAASEYVERMEGEEPFVTSVRFRTVGDMTCTGRRRVDGVHDRGGRRGDRGDARHRARRDPCRRPLQRGRDGRQEARWLLLSRPSAPSFSASSRAARSTTASRR